MKLKHLPPCLVSGILLSVSSCIQDDFLNAECDIVGVDSVWTKNNRHILIGDPVITNSAVNFTVKKGTDRSGLNPSFYLTPGGSMRDNGGIRDFSKPQTYTVYSEDGNWSKNYTISFNYPIPTNTASFEHFELDQSGRYYTWYEIDGTDSSNPRRDIWSSGNAGFAITGMGKTPDSFPTTVDPEGFAGHGVRLTTCSTGSFGRMLGMPIAGGNLFIGDFKAEKATSNPLTATRLGKPGIVSGQPVSISGYYKYQPGPVFTGKNAEPIPDRTDIFDIYAVLYEVNPDNFEPLDGSNSLTSERIVSLARILNPKVADTWTAFEIPFTELQRFDREKLKNNGYALTIVITSSRDAAYFEGAVGSTLHIDEVKITWKE